MRDTRNPMLMPPAPAARPIPAGLGASDLVPTVFSEENYYSATTPGQIVANVPGGKMATCEVGPFSLWDAMSVQAKNGPTILMTPGMRYPLGDWQSPIIINPSAGRPRYNPTALFTGTWLISANSLATNPLRGVGQSLFIAPRVEVITYPSRELAAEQPMQVRRAPLSFQYTITSTAAALSFDYAAIISHHGRYRANLLIASTTHDFVGRVVGIKGNQSVTVYPALPATSFTITAGASLGIEVDGSWDYIAITGYKAAGGNSPIVLAYSAEDL